MASKRAAKPVNEEDVQQLVEGLDDMRLTQTSLSSDVEVSRKAIMKLEHNLKLFKKSYSDHLGDQCPDFIAKMDVRPVITHTQEAVPVRAKKTSTPAPAAHSAVIIESDDEDVVPASPISRSGKNKKKQQKEKEEKDKAAKDKEAPGKKKKEPKTKKKDEEAAPAKTVTAPSKTNAKRKRKAGDIDGEDGAQQPRKKQKGTPEDAKDDDKDGSVASEDAQHDSPQPPKEKASRRPRVDYSIMLTASDEAGRYTHPMVGIKNGVCLMYDDAEVVPFDTKVLRSKMAAVFEMFKVSKAAELTKEQLSRAVCEFVTQMFNSEVERFPQHPLFLEDDVQLVTEGPLRNPVQFIASQPEPLRSILMKMVACWKLLKSDKMEPYELTCIIAACLRRLNTFIVQLRHGHPAADTKADKDGAEKDSSDDEEVASVTEDQSENEQEDDENDAEEDD